MAMICPQCQDVFEQRLSCPSCGVRLAYLAGRLRRSGGPVQGERWSQTPWGRIVIGLLLAQGIYQGLRQLCTAGMLAVGEEPAPSMWATLQGLLILQGLQLLGILVGAALAGAGHKRGAVYGSVVGLGNGLLSLLLLPKGAQVLTPVILYGQPILHTFLGVLGGGFGSTIWRPLQSVALQLPVSEGKAIVPVRKRSTLFSGRIAWGRILLGTAVGVCGTLWAHGLLDLVLDASEGKLTIDSSLQMQIVTWEITALALLAGSALAGAGTSNSLKQGLLVGLASAILLIALRLRTQPERLQMLLVIAASSLTLGLAGSWFGGQLFPPVLRKPRRSRFDSLSY